MRTDGTNALILVLLAQLIMWAATDANAQRRPSAKERAAARLAKKKSEEIKAGIHRYFHHHKIPATTNLREGMNLDEFIKVLGKPTRNYKMQDDQEVIAPSEPFEDWTEWYHNPSGRLHVAPFIRVRIERGIVKEIQSDRM